MNRLVGLSLALALAACSNGDATHDRSAEEVTAVELYEGMPTIDGAAAASASEGKSGPDPSCSEAEQKVFSCTMKSGKQASVCIAGEGDAQFAQYRFGRVGKTAELVWPASADAGVLTFKSVPYSGGGEAQISFTRGDTTYAVFSRVIRTNFEPGEPNYPQIDDGIMVKRNGAMLGELLCENLDLPIDVNLAGRHMKPAAEMIYADQ